MENITYYKQELPTLIDKLKKSLIHLYPIIEQEIDPDIKDDKLLNVLKAKRQAAEDVEWTLKKIDELEADLNGTKKNDSEVIQINHAKRRAEANSK